MTPYPNIYSVIPSPATVTVLTGRGTVSEKCTRGIPVVNPSSSSALSPSVTSITLPSQDEIAIGEYKSPFSVSVTTVSCSRCGMHFVFLFFFRLRISVAFHLNFWIVDPAFDARDFKDGMLAWEVLNALSHFFRGIGSSSRVRSQPGAVKEGHSESHVMQSGNSLFQLTISTQLKYNMTVLKISYSHQDGSRYCRRLKCLLYLLPHVPVPSSHTEYPYLCCCLGMAGTC